MYKYAHIMYKNRLWTEANQGIFFLLFWLSEVQQTGAILGKFQTFPLQ